MGKAEERGDRSASGFAKLAQAERALDDRDRGKKVLDRTARKLAEQKERAARNLQAKPNGGAARSGSSFGGSKHRDHESSKRSSGAIWAGRGHSQSGHQHNK